MLGERDAVVVDVRRYEVHGVPHAEVVVSFSDDGSTASARIGAESVPPDLGVGEAVVVRLVMATIVEIRRPSQDPVPEPPLS